MVISQAYLSLEGKCTKSPSIISSRCIYIFIYILVCI